MTLLDNTQNSSQATTIGKETMIDFFIGTYIGWEKL